MPCELLKTVEDVPRELDSFEELVAMFMQQSPVSCTVTEDAMLMPDTASLVTFTFEPDEQIRLQTFRHGHIVLTRRTHDDLLDFSEGPIELVWGRTSPLHEKFHLLEAVFRTTTKDEAALRGSERTVWSFDQATGILVNKTVTLMSNAAVQISYLNITGPKPLYSISWSDDANREPLQKIVTQGTQIHELPLELYEKEAGHEICRRSWKSDLRN